MSPQDTIIHRGVRSRGDPQILFKSLVIFTGKPFNGDKGYPSLQKNLCPHRPLADAKGIAGFATGTCSQGKAP